MKIERKCVAKRKMETQKQMYKTEWLLLRKQWTKICNCNRKCPFFDEHWPLSTIPFDCMENPHAAQHDRRRQMIVDANGKHKKSNSIIVVIMGTSRQQTET